MINLIEQRGPAWVFELQKERMFATRRDELMAVAEILAALLRHGRHIIKQGRGIGSLEGDETAGLDYTVVTGDVIAARLEWLDNLYRCDEVIAVLSAACGTALRPSEDVPSSINLNLLHGHNKRYERHVDGVGYSAVLMISDLTYLDGGELKLSPDGGECMTFTPAFGKIVLFNAATVPHEVLPLKSTRRRVTVPMVYLPPDAADRPPGLDAYLYK